MNADERSQALNVVEKEEKRRTRFLLFGLGGLAVVDVVAVVVSVILLLTLSLVTSSILDGLVIIECATLNSTTRGAPVTREAAQAKFEHCVNANGLNVAKLQVRAAKGLLRKR